MAIEGENGNQVIPPFDAASFLADDNEVGQGGYVNGVNQLDQQQKPEESEEEEEVQYSFDDDFLEVSKGSPKVDESKKFNPEDYSVLSEQLGVEIKSQEQLDEIKAKFNQPNNDVVSKPNQNNSSYDFTPEEDKSYNMLSQALEGANKSTPEDLMKWHLKQVNPNADYENNPEDLDYHIETLKDTGIFDSQEKSVREKLINEITQQQNTLTESANNRKLESTTKLNRELEQNIKSYKDGFHGINLSPKDLVETFKSINDGSIFDEIESTQANVAEVALLWKNRKLFYNAFENPNPSVGVKKIMDELQNSKPKPAAGNQTLRNPLVFDPYAFLESEDIKTKASGNQ